MLFLLLVKRHSQELPLVTELLLLKHYTGFLGHYLVVNSLKQLHYYIFDELS